MEGVLKIKKITLTAIIITVMVSIVSGIIPVSGNANVTVTVDGKKVIFPDAKPFIDENGRTLIPVRFVTEDLGANVEWNAESREVYITKDGVSIMIRIGEERILANGSTKIMDTKAIIRYDRTYVPIRYVAEELGATVGWDAGTRTVIITTVKDVQPTPTPSATPTPTVEYDPAKWVNVIEDEASVELYIVFGWSDIREVYLKDCDYAESVIAKKYNAEIAKKVMDIARSKTHRRDNFTKIIEFEGKQIEIVSSGGIMIYFWKEGIKR